MAPRGSWSGIALSQLLALAFMAACLWRVLYELAFILPADRITASLSVQQVLGGALSRQLLAFGAALALCHALLGVTAFGLARLTEVAYPAIELPRRSWLVAGWFAVLVTLVMTANAGWHPGSLFASEDSWLHQELLGQKPAVLFMGMFVACVSYLASRAVIPLVLERPRAVLIAAGVCVLAYAATALPPARAGSPSAAPIARQPHLVIIGVDSLRADLVDTGTSSSLTPHIDAFLAAAHRFDDTVSPLARTYGAWVTILTGRHPVATNARVNLMPRTLVREGATLADAVREHGYRAVYATDEVRFANIDESFGFDQVIAPPIGAIDFLLGYVGDQPLVNLVAPTTAGARLFPSNHANRAAHVTYEPGDFVARLEHELQVAGPSLLAMHLTLAHWPYNWSGMAAPGTPQEYRPAYRRAVEAVDRQFDQIMRLLAAKGVLENAVVVVLSDHGEALGGATDSMLRGTGNSREIWDSLWGHGTSVMSPHQYSVLLALRAYGRARLPGTPARHDWPASLEDVRPTLEELATGKAPAGLDGVSLLPALADPALRAELTGRLRFTETDFNTPSTLAGRYEASGVIDEAAVYYELNPETGWVQFRPDRLPQLLASKQRAAISTTSLLAAIPGLAGNGTRYLFTDRRNPAPRRLVARPDPTSDAEAARLWDALQARFPGELPPPAEAP